MTSHASTHSAVISFAHSVSGDDWCGDGTAWNGHETDNLLALEYKDPILLASKGAVTQSYLLMPGSLNGGSVLYVKYGIATCDCVIYSYLK